ncbi:MAG: lactate dehydrogenase, partial [Thermotaleaceae bacterium]
MFYYRFDDKLCFSLHEYKDLTNIEEKEARNGDGILYALLELNPEKSRRSFCLSEPALLTIKEEGLHLLQLQKRSAYSLPSWLQRKIEVGEVMAVNRAYPNWKDVFIKKNIKKWRIHLAGLGDVGSTLLMGLRLLGGSCIESIGIFDRSIEKSLRWQLEINQIWGFGEEDYPSIDVLKEESLFECDLFIFSIAARVPPIGEEGQDVRMVQLEENGKIISSFGKLARSRNYKGIFAVVSDPVDLLCKTLLQSSNTNEDGHFDFNGLAPEQIRGYGLGVMHARALYYAQQHKDTHHYQEEGRAFGPHGEGLVIADSISRYDMNRSLFLTEKAKTANLEVRKTGFKPFVAPALSSGALPLIATMEGRWHYSATYMGGVYMGAKNRLRSSGTELEMLDIPPALWERLQYTY